MQKKCPLKTLAILEARDRIGGTWDLFCYPGVRSDSDMFTLGYSFRPWIGAKSIADGRSILDYIVETAREHNIDRKVRYNHRVTRASWSSNARRWTIEVESGVTRQPANLTCDLSSCAAAITTMRRVSSRRSPVWLASRANSCIRRTGPRTSTMPTSGWS